MRLFNQLSPCQFDVGEVPMVRGFVDGKTDVKV